VGLEETPTLCWVGDSPRVPVSCRPAAAVGGSEAEESHVQAEILDEQGRDGRGAGVAGKLRQAGGAGPLPMPFPGAWLSPRHWSRGAGREMGRSPCHACPADGVALPTV